MQVTDDMVEVAARAMFANRDEFDARNSSEHPAFEHNQEYWEGQARAALEAALAAMWRPIEEAQKNGDEYLCMIPGIGMGQMVLYWSDGYWREKANGLGLKIEPTHFMPLPSPPIREA